MKTILDKEETIKKIKSQLKPCNDGSCHISRQGKSHLSHHKINKSYIRLAVTLLASLEVLLLIVTIIIKDPHDPVNNITIFLAAIPFAGFTIWYSRQLHEDQKQYSEFLQYKETMNYSDMKGEWNKVIENGKIAYGTEKKVIAIPPDKIDSTVKKNLGKSVTVKINAI